MRVSAAMFLFFALLLSSCGGGDDSGSVGSTPAVDSTVPQTDGEGAAATTTVAGQPGPAEATFLKGFDQSVQLATATEGGGIRPLLEWDTVVGADHYGVYLYAPDGRLYWSWRGRELSVYVGGAVQIGEHAAGPAVVPGMNWAVVAYDADLAPIAASGLRPIGP